MGVVPIRGMSMETVVKGMHIGVEMEHRQMYLED